MAATFLLNSQTLPARGSLEVASAVGSPEPTSGEVQTAPLKGFTNDELQRVVNSLVSSDFVVNQINDNTLELKIGDAPGVVRLLSHNSGDLIQLSSALTTLNPYERQIVQNSCALGWFLEINSAGFSFTASSLSRHKQNRLDATDEPSAVIYRDEFSPDLSLQSQLSRGLSKIAILFPHPRSRGGIPSSFLVVDDPSAVEVLQHTGTNVQLRVDSRRSDAMRITVAMRRGEEPHLVTMNHQITVKTESLDKGRAAIARITIELGERLPTTVSTNQLASLMRELANLGREFEQMGGRYFIQPPLPPSLQLSQAEKPILLVLNQQDSVKKPVLELDGGLVLRPVVCLRPPQSEEGRCIARLSKSLQIDPKKLENLSPLEQRNYITKVAQRQGITLKLSYEDSAPSANGPVGVEEYRRTVEGLTLLKGEGLTPLTVLNRAWAIMLHLNDRTAALNESCIKRGYPGGLQQFYEQNGPKGFFTRP